MSDAPPPSEGPETPQATVDEPKDDVTEIETPEGEEVVDDTPKKENAEIDEELAPDKRGEAEVQRTEIRRKAPLHTRSMRGLRIGKVVVNICTGQSGEPLNRAMTILENLTGQRPCTRLAKQTIRTFGIRRKEPISCMVTLREKRAEEFLRKGFAAIGNRINPRSFDRQGNFAFGIREHIDIPGQRYDPNLGITGMDIMVTVERPGYRVSRKRRGRSRIGRSHRVNRGEAIEFIKQSFGVEVGLPGE